MNELMTQIHKENLLHDHFLIKWSKDKLPYLEE